MFDVIIDTLIDALKLLPFLFASFLLLEFFEHKMNERTRQTIKSAGKLGPLVGGLLGAVPQCGFATMASSMYTTRVVTLGTLIAVFLSTSDEMLVIMIAKNDINVVKQGLIIVAIKILIGVFVGFIVDLVLRRKKLDENERIHDFCENDNCHCEHGIIRSAIHHAFKIFIYILIINFVLNFAFHYLGEENISKILLQNSIFAPVISSIVGFIPNCASSVVITEMYLSGAISFGSCIAGLLTGSGMGLVILFKVNKPIKQNFIIIAILFLTAIVFGSLIDLIGIKL